MKIDRQGYLTQAEIDELQDDYLPPAILREVLERLRALKQSKGNAHLQLHVHVHVGDPVEYKFDPDIRLRRKRAS